MQEHPGAKLAQVSKMLGEAWKSLSDAQKAPYIQQAEKLKQK